MKGINKVILIGNVGNEPEVKVLTDNSPVAKFSLATTESYKDASGQRQSQTEWHTILAWQGLAQWVGKYLHKGSLIYVEGKLKTRSYQDKITGKNCYVTEIIAQEITLLDKKPNE